MTDDHGDPVVRDKQGQWSYQLSVVVDDMHDGVNLIIRGTDLIASTGRQLLLAQLRGRKSEFVTVHHPLLLDADGKKISKRTSTAGSTRHAAGSECLTPSSRTTTGTSSR